MLESKLIMYDIKNGFISNRIKILFFILVICVINIIGVNSIHRSEEMYGVSATIMDQMCFVLGGPPYIPKGMFELYTIPLLWLIQNAMIAYIIGYYATNDVAGYGVQILMRSGARERWWLSKCVWNGVTVVVLHLWMYIITAVVAVAGHEKISFSLTTKIVTDVCNIGSMEGKMYEYAICIFLMPLIVSITISALQITVALITSPVIAFLTVESVMLLSTMFSNRILFPNYGMLSHNMITCGSDINIWEGIAVCGIIYIVSIVMGLVYFSRMNIIIKERQI